MTQSRRELFSEAEKHINKKGFSIVDKDWDRPWGGFFVIDEDEAPAFAKTYFESVSAGELEISGKLSPKILMVEPEKRLSWQYHNRRAEIWSVIDGPVGVVRSKTDEQGPVQTYKSGELIKLSQGERHRLVGMSSWGILAEIWQHTDPENPSDEQDIVRLQDDFGR